MRETCLNMVYELAKIDERVVFIGSDLSPNLLSKMRDEFPDRYYMEGVYEANIIGMAAGLAMEGYIPYVNTIATFLTRRCYEQIAVDICMHKLPIRLIANGGGVVYAPLGPTHLATEDLSIMQALPDMTVTAVSDAEEIKRLMHASLDWPHPIYIRMGKGGDPVVSKPENHFAIGKAIKLYERQQQKPLSLLLISTGVMTQRVLAVAKALEELPLNITLLHCHTVKPLDKETILTHAKQAHLVATFEENTLIGGFGSAILACLNEQLGLNTPLIKCFGLPDRFADKYGTQDQLLDYFGLSPEKLEQSILQLLQTQFSSSLAKKDERVPCLI